MCQNISPKQKLLFKNNETRTRPMHLVEGKGLLSRSSVHKNVYTELSKCLVFTVCSKKIGWMNKYFPFVLHQYFSFLSHFWSLFILILLVFALCCAFRLGAASYETDPQVPSCPFPDCSSCLHSATLLMNYMKLSH